MKTFSFLSLLLLFVNPSSQTQDKTTADRVLNVFKINAGVFLKNRVDLDFGDTKDELQVAKKLAKLNLYETQLEEVDRRLKAVVQQKNLSSKMEIFQVAKSEYKKSFPDLTQDFYEKTNKDVNALNE